MLRRLSYRIGRRGAVLLYLAFVAGLQAYILASPVDGEHGGLALYVATLMPLPAWAALWGVVALLALINAFRLHDRTGFTAVGAISVLWGLVALGGYLTGELHAGYRQAAIWLGVAAMTLIIATWPEHVGGRDD